MPHFDEQGQPIAHDGPVTDITGRKQAGRNIALMTFALDSIHEAVCLVDENARLHYVNEEYCRLLEYSRDELLGMSVPDVNLDFPWERWPDH